MFLSGSVWVILTCGTIFGSVAFGAEFEDEEEEAEPGCGSAGLLMLCFIFGLRLYLCFCNILFMYVLNSLFYIKKNFGT